MAVRKNNVYEKLITPSHLVFNFEVVGTVVRRE